MNKVVLIGRLTADPNLSYAAGTGTAVCRFTLAVNRMKKKDQEKADADFPNCIAFGKTAETIANYLTKGRQMALVGHIQTGSYDAKDGTRRYTTDVVVENFEFIGNNQGQAQKDNADNYNFDNDMIPVDDRDMPF